MKSVFTRGRIRGVTHHRSQSPLGGGNPNLGNSVAREALNLTLADLQKAVPQPLSHPEIHMLLGDLGRQTLHTLVSDCIVHASHWRQVSTALDRHLDRSGRPLSRKAEGPSVLLELDSDDAGYFPGTDADPRQWLAIEVRRVFRLWQQRLSMLEMIADGQSTAQWEMRLALKTSRPRVR